MVFLHFFQSLRGVKLLLRWIYRDKNIQTASGNSLHQFCSQFPVQIPSNYTYFWIPFSNQQHRQRFQHQKFFAYYLKDRDQAQWYKGRHGQAFKCLRRLPPEIEDQSFERNRQYEGQQTWERGQHTHE
jgi:hypothetical protein